MIMLPYLMVFYENNFNFIDSTITLSRDSHVSVVTNENRFSGTVSFTMGASFNLTE